MTRVIVWDENPSHHDAALYPRGIRGAVADLLSSDPSFTIAVAHQDEEDNGLPAARLLWADTLIFWAHVRQSGLAASTCQRIRHHVEQGMGLVLLHSATISNLTETLFGERAHVKGGWDHTPQDEVITVCAPQHPIAAEVGNVTLVDEEFYGAPIQFPPPEVIVFQSFFPRIGRWCPSGLVWTLGPGIQEMEGSGPGEAVGQGEGRGRIFYFRPGHETSPSYLHPWVGQVLRNAAHWAARRPE